MLVVGLNAREAPAADGRPNFVFVIADDHRWDAMGTVQREQGKRARYPWFKDGPVNGTSATVFRLTDCP
jgi:hypothetical protein